MPAAIPVAVFVAFIPALSADFVDFDDPVMIVNKPAYRGFSASHLRWMFTTRLGGPYQPLAWLSYAVDDALFDRGLYPLEPFGYHFTNVLLHVLSALLFYYVARIVLTAALRAGPAPLRSADDARRNTLAAGARGGGSASADGSATPTAVMIGALTAALFFAVHPLRAESVAWITERRDVLSQVFYLAAILAYLRYARAGGKRYYVLCGVAFVGALLSKATTVVLPVILLILDVYPLRRCGRRAGCGSPENVDEAGSVTVVETAKAPETDAARQRSVWTCAFEKLPLLIVATAVGVLALRGQQQAGAMLTLTEYPLSMRFAQASYGLIFYVYKTFVPVSLGPMIEIPPRDVLLGGLLWASLAVNVVVGVILYRLRRRHPAWIVAFMAYLVGIFFMLGFFQSGQQLVADRFSYLSCLPWALLVGGGVGVAWDRVHRSRRRAARAVFALALACGYVALHHSTFRQAGFWRDSLTLWRRGEEVCPTSAFARIQYGGALARGALQVDDRVSLRAAAQQYRLATGLKPNDAIGWHYLGTSLALLDESPIQMFDAERALREAIRLDPDRVRAYVDLADLLLTARSWPGGQRDDLPIRAAAILRQGAGRHPEDADIVDYPVSLLATHPRADVRDGAEALRWAVVLTDGDGVNNPYLLNTLASAQAEAGDPALALDTATQARRLAVQQRRARLVHEIDRRMTFYRRGQPFHGGSNAPQPQTTNVRPPP